MAWSLGTLSRIGCTSHVGVLMIGRLLPNHRGSTGEKWSNLSLPQLDIGPEKWIHGQHVASQATNLKFNLAHSAWPPKNESHKASENIFALLLSSRLLAFASAACSRRPRLPPTVRVISLSSCTSSVLGAGDGSFPHLSASGSQPCERCGKHVTKRRK